MLTTDTAIHSNTQQYKVLYYYTIHSTGLRIASAGSVVEEPGSGGRVVRRLRLLLPFSPFLAKNTFEGDR